MLTIFSTPKPFRGHINIIQRNAIKSWKLLNPECEIILFGNDEGVSDVAAEFGLRHQPDIDMNEYGTPLVSDLFKQASQVASQNTICYVNCDIILMNDFLEAIKRISDIKKRFMIIGHHWRMDIEELLLFEDGWAERLREKTLAGGRKVTIWAMDYFIFPKNEHINMPPMAIGRPRWDNWLVYRARALYLPVIDISEVVMVIHQNHDYGHVPKGSGKSFEGPEADANRLSLKEHGEDEDFGFEDATHKLTSRGLRRALERRYLSRHMYTIPKFYPRLTPLVRITVAVIMFTLPARVWLKKIFGRSEK